MDKSATAFVLENYPETDDEIEVIIKGYKLITKRFDETLEKISKKRKAKKSESAQ